MTGTHRYLTRKEKELDKPRPEWQDLFKYTSRSKPSGGIYIIYEQGSREYLVEGVRKVRVGKRNKPFSQEC